MVSIITGIRALWLTVQFGSTEPEDYRAEVGSFLLSKAGLALVLSLIGAGGVWFCRRFRFVALAIALVTAGASTLILIGGEVEARGRLNNFGPELEAVNEFIPPRAAELVSTKTTASSQPIVSRYWQIPGSFGEVEAASRRSFETWADPGTVMAPTT